ncbi:MAG: phosphoribosylanthranilate isomerase [Lachnospiraceae bacterium]|nr:phosphoribosylanthranilate isomerase [Lachnospiraceae bacterium]
MTHISGTDRSGTDRSGTDISGTDISGSDGSGPAKIKLCGLSRPCDITAANALRPDYIGFVFAPKSRRYVSKEQALRLRSMLDPSIKTVGVFVDTKIEEIARMYEEGVIDIAQLHGSEDDVFIRRLKELMPGPVIKAVRVGSAKDAEEAEGSAADHILFDSGAGTGEVFDWSMLGGIRRPYFLAGGLDTENVAEALHYLHPFAVDVSSGIETDGFKDEAKMRDFVFKVRNTL